nr:TetR/AcrR family transcriptional regulator [Rhizobium paranaense]
MRKEPSQARSRATVDAIIEAGARILGDHGWACFTTNTVAAVAGISIGSLYQYFPDKLSLVEAIRRRHFDEVLTVLRQATASDLPLQRSVEALVQGMIDAHSVNPELHRVLLDEVPGLEGSRSAMMRFWQTIKIITGVLWLRIGAATLVLRTTFSLNSSPAWWKASSITGLERAPWIRQS